MTERKPGESLFDIFNGKAVKTRMEYPSGLPDVAKKFPSYLVDGLRDQFEQPQEIIDKERCPVLKLVFQMAEYKKLKVHVLDTSRDDYLRASMGIDNAAANIGSRSDRVFVDVTPDAQGVRRITRCYIG